MGFFKPARRGLALGIGGALALAIASAGLTPAAASAAGTANIKVTVGSSQSKAGNVIVENTVQTTTYGTCAAPSTPGSKTCTIPVPTKSGVLLLAQPASGEALGMWTGKCKGAPGPVCHIQSRGNGRTTASAVTLVRAGSGPTVTASPEYVFGPTPNGCSAAAGTTVSAVRFPANSHAKLRDDGHVVASTTTNGSGKVTFAYTPAASEPGVYRTLTITAGSHSAGTDVYNSGHFCIVSNSPSTGMDTLTADVSGLDANSTDNYIQVAGQQPTVINADATGAGSATTPAFACEAGQSITYRLYGVRGVGTSAKYSYNDTGLTYPC